MSIRSTIFVRALVEDKSGAIIVEAILKSVAERITAALDYRVFGHRGCGRLPADWLAKPNLKEQSLLGLLPAKMRAYCQLHTKFGSPDLLIVVMDADDHDPNLLFEQLQHVAQVCGRDLPVVFGLAIEELEAWLLGDRAAIQTAYPTADFEQLKHYVQDSVCGTWEHLCAVLLGDRAEALIEKGYPVIGKFKHQWAQQIAPHLVPERNASASFQRFYRSLLNALQNNSGRNGVSSKL